MPAAHTRLKPSRSLLSRARHLGSRLWRLPHLGGNGVHSPYAYSLICEVLCNHSAYYAYTDLKDWLEAMSHEQQELAKLIFRLTNHQQPAAALVPQEMEAAVTPFISRACQKVQVTPYDDITAVALPLHPVMLLAPTPDDVPARLPQGSMAIILDIRRDRATRRAWREQCGRPEHTLSFDLYRQGLLLSRPGLNKKHYIVNY